MTYLLVRNFAIPLDPLPAFSVSGQEVFIAAPFTSSVTMTRSAGVNAKTLANALLRLKISGEVAEEADLWRVYEEIKAEQTVQAPTVDPRTPSYLLPPKR